jgi:hypothetical protein
MLEAARNEDYTLGELPPEVSDVFLGVDPAVAASGYCAIVAWGFERKTKRRFLLDVFNKQGMRTWDNVADAIIAALPALPALEQALSQPGSEPAVAHGVRINALVHEALGFVMRHPGCAQSSAPARYTARYRRFVIALRKRYADITASEFADVLALPLGTLEGWMAGGCGAVEAGCAPNPDEPHATAHNAAQP